MSKISELSDGGSLQSTDYLIAVRSGGNVKVRANGAVSGTTGQFSTSLNVDGTVTADGLTVDGSLATINSSGPNVDLVLTEGSTNTDARIRNSNGILEIDADLNNEFGNSSIVFAVDGTDKLKINNNGDISFYEDTGTTPKFFWDASAESLGIGTTSPSTKLHLGGSAPLDSIIRQDSTVSGTNWEIGERSAGKWQIWEDDSDSVVATFQSNGNVGIGTTSPGCRLHAKGSGELARLETTGATGDNYLTFRDASAIKFYFGFTSAGTENFEISNVENGALVFGTNNSERMRIDSNGFLNIGVSTAISSSTNTSDGFTFAPSGGYAWLSVSDTGGIYVQRQNDNSVFSFYRGSSNVGSISVTSSATVYNTLSDQRLKDNITDAPSASDDIDAIQVRSFDWKADGSHQKYGMVAQELQSVAPEAVSGDADSDDMMGVDYSKLVPMLVKEIQSLRARVAQLEGA